MKLLKIIIAVLIIAACTINVFATIIKEPFPDDEKQLHYIQYIFDKYLILSGNREYSCDNNEKVLNRLVNLFGEDIKNQLTYSDNSILVHGYKKNLLVDEKCSLITAEANGSKTHLTSIVLAEDVTKQIYRGQIDKEDFDSLPDDFRAYIENVRLMSNVWEQNCFVTGVTITEEAFETDGYIDLPIRDISDEDIDEDLRGGPIYSDARESYKSRRNLESDYSGDVFMTAPNRIIVCYEQGYRIWNSNMPNYQAEYYDFYIMLDYDAPEGFEEGDYMSYELESISFELVYDPHSAISAPQTGFATYAYAAVAVVAAAGAVAVAKRRRKAI